MSETPDPIRASGPSPSERDRRVESLAEQFLDLLQSGQAPDRHEWVEANSEIGEELDRHLAVVEMMFQARPMDGAPPVDREAATLAPSVSVTAPGSRIRYFGDYELLEEIARGGMGVVFKARQVSLNRLVAIKMILAGQLAGPDDVRRFRAEAEAAAQLQHPNIVAIHEVGEHDGQHYFSMDYVEGTSLAALVRESPLPAKQAAAIVKTVAEAIHYAHAKGILHRDLKPSNVLMERVEGRGLRVEGPAGNTSDLPTLNLQPSTINPRVTDFGLAKRIEGGSELTGTGQILGTPSYMPPEQAGSKRGEIGPASDVYSLGAILYELLVGRPPFRAETPLDTVLQVLDSEPVAPRLLNPKIDKDLETISLKCLQKLPARRYGSADELAADLNRYLRGEPIQARPVGRVERSWRWCLRNPVVASLVAAVWLSLVVGAVVSTYFAIKSNHRAIAEAKQRREAERQTRQANAHRLAAQAREVMKEFPQRSLLLAAEAVKTTLNAGEPPVPAAEQILRDALARMSGRALRGKIDTISAVALSSDHHWLATGGQNGVVHVWNLAADDPSANPILLQSHTLNVIDLRFSNDDRRLLSASGDSVRVWDFTSADPTSNALAIQPPTGMNRIVLQASSPDLHWVITSSERVTEGEEWDSGPTLLWDLQAEPLSSAVVDEHQIEPDGLLSGSGFFSPDGRYLVFESFRGENWNWWIRICDLSQDNPLGRSVVLGQTSFNIQTYAFSPNGRWLVTGRNRVETMKGLNTYDVFDLGEPDSVVRLWDLQAAHPLTPIALPHQQRVKQALFSPNSRWLATKGVDGTIRLWDLTAKDQAAAPFVVLGTKESFGWYEGVEFSADSRWLATLAERGELRLWDLSEQDPASASRILRLVDDRAFVEKARFSADSKWLLAHTFWRTVIWSLDEGFPKEPSFTPRNSGHSLTKLAAIRSPDYYDIVTAIATEERNVLLFSNQEQPDILHGLEHAPSILAFGSNQRWLVAANAEEPPRLWDMRVFKGQVTVQHPSPIQLGGQLARPGKSMTIVDGAEHVVRKWDSNERAPASRPISFGTPEEVDTSSYLLRGSDWALSPDEQWLAIGHDATSIRLWELSGETPEGTLLRSHDAPVTVLFTPDSRCLVAGEWERKESRGDSVHVWRISPGEAAEGPFVLGVPNHPVRRIAISPDSRWLITDHEDQGVHIWDLKAKGPSFESVQLPRKHRLPIEFDFTVVAGSGFVSPRHHARIGAQFTTPNLLITAGEEKSAFVWDLSSANFKANPIVLPGHEEEVETVVPSHDGRWVVTIARVTGVPGTIDEPTLPARLWDLKASNSGARPIVLRVPDSQVQWAYFTPCNDYLITGTYFAAELDLWNLTQPDPSANSLRLVAPDWFDIQNVGHAAIVSDGRSLAVHFDESRTSHGKVREFETIRVWDLTAPNPVATQKILESQTSEFLSMAISPDGRRLAAGSSDGTVRVWDLSDSKPDTTAITLLSKHGVNRVGFTDDNLWLFSESDDEILLWHLRPEDLLQIASGAAARDLTEEERKLYMAERASGDTR